MTPPGTGARRAFGARWRTLADRVRTLSVERDSLRTRPMIGLVSDHPSPADAVRWLGPVSIAGRSVDALFCHPTSHAEYRLAVCPGDQIVGWVSLVPDVWSKNRGGVDFSVTVRRLDGKEVVRGIHVDPAGRSADRGWRRFRVPVRVDRAQDVTIVLSTAVPAGARGDHAWAIWGDPAIERRRATAAIWADLRNRIRRTRLLGPRGPRRARGRLPSADPTSRYRAWLDRHPLTLDALTSMRAEAERLPYRPLISIITPVYNTDPGWLRACIESVQRQAYPHWELCLCDDASTSLETRAVLDAQADARIRVVRLDRNAHISAASNAALGVATGEFVALLDHDDELTPDALFEVAAHLNRESHADVVYSDEDKLDPDGRRSDPFFKPDWSPDHLLSAMYTSHLTVARRTLVDHVGGFRVGYEGSQDHDLALRLSEATPAFHHIPRVLYHWRRVPGSTASSGAEKPWAQDAGARALQDCVQRRGLEGLVEWGGVPGLYRVRFAIRGDPLVSVIVVSADRDASSVRTCSTRLRELTAYRRLEILGVDEPFLSTTGDVNAAVRRSAGSHFVCVDAGLEPASVEWLSALLEYSQQQAIGAVGARIVYADGRLRHIGLLLGVAPGVARAMHQHPGAGYGYFSSAIGVRNYSAVSGECLMTRRALFDELGGFDERLPWSVADVDYCLRAARAGGRTVFTPYAQLRRRSAAPAAEATPPADAIAALRRVWGDRLDRDPYYNSNLSRQTPDYQLPWTSHAFVDVALHRPLSGVLQDPLNLRIEGWITGIGDWADLRALEIYAGDDRLGATEVFFRADDVEGPVAAVPEQAVGFSMLLNAPQLLGRPSADLTWRVDLRDGTSTARGTFAVPLIKRDYRQAHYGVLLGSEMTAVFHRADIYGSGPSAAEPSPACLALIRRYFAPGPKQILDVGCGFGAYGPPLRADGHDWFGVEVKSSDCEELARRGLPHRHVDGRMLPFGPSSFEHAICIEVLEHIDEPAPFLSEIRRVIQGRLLLSVPNAELISYLQDLGVVPWHLLEGDHKNFFGRASLRALLLQHFRRVEVLSYGGLPVRTVEGLSLDVHLFAVCDV